VTSITNDSSAVPAYVWLLGYNLLAFGPGAAIASTMKSGPSVLAMQGAVAVIGPIAVWWMIGRDTSSTSILLIVATFLGITTVAMVHAGAAAVGGPPDSVD